MFLDSEDIEKLSGYKFAAHQIKWLQQNGIKFLIGGDGKPRILISHLNEVMGLESKPTRKPKQPNREALMRHMGLI